MNTSASLPQSRYVLFVNPIGLHGWLSRLSDADHRILHEQVGPAPSGDPMSQEVVNAFEQLRGVRSVLTVFAGRPVFQPHIKLAIIGCTSAVVVADELLPLASMSVELMWAFFRFKVAARMAVARGTFTHASFSVSVRPWGTVLVNVPFWGSGIERAHRAEASSLAPGLRVLIHPSAVEGTTAATRPWCVPLPVSQRTSDCAHEINIFDGALQPTAAGLHAPRLADLETFAIPTADVRDHVLATRTTLAADLR